MRKKKEKGKRGKRISEHNYINAYYIMYGKWLNIDPCDYSDNSEESMDEIKTSEVIISNEISAEEKIIRKEEWFNLSEEAREVISTIVMGPSEILDIIKTPERKLLTKKSITKYFRELWKSKFISNYAIKEITKWVNQL